MIPAAALAMFVRCMRLNPSIPADDPIVPYLLEAYVGATRDEALEIEAAP